MRFDDFIEDKNKCILKVFSTKSKREAKYVIQDRLWKMILEIKSSREKLIGEREKIKKLI